MKLSCIAFLLFLALGSNLIAETEANGNEINEAFEEFRRANKIPPWALIQRTPWGIRSFFKRELASLTFDCTYVQSTRLFSCSGLNKTFECESFSIFDKSIPEPFRSFGISALPVGGSKTKFEEVKFSLYPQSLSEKNVWFDTRFEDPIVKKFFTYSLYFNTGYTDSGLRVLEPVCWKKIYDFFTTSTVRTERWRVLKEDGQFQEIDFLGRLLIK